MVQVTKHEWHQVDAQYVVDFDEELLSEIYPELDETEIQVILTGLQDGTYDIQDVINEADENGIDIEWDSHYEDWWTMRKGGYEVTYDIGE